MPVGALGTREASGKLRLSAAIASLDGKTVLKAEATGEVDADLVAQVAKELMDQGAETLLNDIRAELNS